MLFQGNSVRVFPKPGLEALQFRIQLAREFDAAGPAEIVLEIVLELEHVAEIVGAGETETAKYFGRYGVVADILSQRLAHAVGHLCAGQVFSRDAHRLSDEFLSLLEYTEGAFADVFRRDARELAIAHRDGETEAAVLALFGPMPKKMKLSQ